MRSHCSRTRFRCILEDRARHIEAFTHEKRMTVDLAVTAAQVEACYPAMRELRPHLDADTFVRVVREPQRDGYLLAALLVQGLRQGVVAVAEGTRRGGGRTPDPRRGAACQRSGRPVSLSTFQGCLTW